MIRTIIVDDEAHNRDTLTRLLARHCPQITLVGEASGVAEGIDVIQTLQPDLVLLDVNMKDGSGFDLLHSLNAIDFKIIFVSAFDKDTIRAIRLSGFEYLLKPVNPSELMAAVCRVIQCDKEYFKVCLKALDANVRK